MSSVLFVITAADRWTLKDGSTHPTGYWGEEVAEPHRRFSDAGREITIATPGGVTPTLDRSSVRIPTKAIRRARRYLTQIAPALQTPRRLDEIDHTDYDVVFHPGGHGPMEDLAYDETSGTLLADRLASGRPLALLCHAPAAILAAKNTRRQPGADVQLTHHSDAGSQGGFNWSSQRLDFGGVGWEEQGSRCRRLRPVRGGSGRRIGRCGRRCVHRAALSRHGRCSGSSGA